VKTNHSCLLCNEAGGTWNIKKMPAILSLFNSAEKRRRIERNGRNMKTEKKESWFSNLLSYAKGSRGKLFLSVVLSVVSVLSGIVPYYCAYRIIDHFVTESVTTQNILQWGGLALLAYLIKVVFFGCSTGLSHYVAYHILEKLRIRVADRFLHAPLGEVTSHSIGEIKNVIVDKIEGVEPPLAHMIPEGAGHFILPLVSFAALITIDWRIALASLATVPVSLICMVLTFVISGKMF